MKEELLIMKNKNAILTFKQKQFGRNIFIVLLALKMNVFMSSVLLFSEKKKKKKEAYQIMALLAKEIRLGLNNSAMIFSSPEMIH